MDYRHSNIRWVDMDLVDRLRVLKVRSTNDQNAAVKSLRLHIALAPVRVETNDAALERKIAHWNSRI